MRKKRFEMLLLKNTLAIAIPAVAVFLVLIFMFLKYPVFEKVKCNTIDEAADISATLDTLYMEGTTNVEYKANGIKYTGIDYIVDGKHKGSYYYSIEDKNVQIFLIKTDNPVHELNETIKGAIIKDEISTNYIVSQMMEKTDIEPGLLKNYISNYVISEVDYPHVFIAMVYILFLVPILICAAILGYTVIVWINPAIHAESRQLEVYGDPREVIYELDNQLKNSLIYKTGHIYITGEYMLVSYLTRTDVIRLDLIKYLSKNEVDVKRGIAGTSIVYRLTMSNPDKMFYEVDFNDEEIIDTIIEYIKDVNQYGPYGRNVKEINT